MRLQLASDLHLECLTPWAPALRIVEPADGVDVLVLAGDIANGTAAVALFADWPARHVVFVAGNHEYYDADWQPMRGALKAAARGTKVQVLDDDALVLDGVRFLGTTLWTDFAVTGPGRDAAMIDCARRVMDYRAIRSGGAALRPHETLAAHAASRAWLEAELARPFAGPTVVVSHHAPHPLSIHERYAGQAINAAYVSDLSPLLPQADLWLHGHVHDAFDYRVGRCRVVANPAGYVRNRAQAAAGAPVELENRAFEARRVIDL